MKKLSKKAFAALLLTALVATTLLTGCDPSPQAIRDAEAARTKENVVQETSQEVTQETTQEATTAQEAEKDTASTNMTGQPEGIEGAINGEDSSKENPIPFGTWGTVGAYSTVDHLYHNVYAKITNVSMDQDYVQQMVDKHNENAGITLDLSSIDLPSDVKLGVMEYLMYIPENYPTFENGVSSFCLGFKVVNKESGGFPSNDGASVYLALGSSRKDLVIEDANRYEPGSTYKLAVLFVMVEGYENYCFAIDTYKDGCESNTETMYSAYFAKN